ncbi:molybdopterin-guanine dinucleotide biosynthesis protein B [Jannaschia ovalis]|uniref:Molybdopterin-guanine dinucleotide biosynthesis protein B n=1 Tax=Jannaschia ovalis TaxID=3038773 RepID=A0ABY8LF35_9RHOB|nr:molybdopterin-guanine dinucleotide biosynthesis protein B [Jannaschia sp. GRR-S6-38]WGH79786.1 molybdopterin-guanine dinucleotide biosynthesis protein B [Jannaschia sp. GRR-S6-38]
MRLIGIVGHKNGGKTTLTERLVAEMTSRGLTVSTLKRSHHALDLDSPGTDSFRHRAAGAHQVALVSDARLTLMEERAGLSLEDALARLAPCDVALAEGWKRGTHFRIEAWRPETGAQPLAQTDAGIAAVAAGATSIRAMAASGPCDVTCPVFDLNDVAAIADFVLR